MLSSVLTLRFAAASTAAIFSGKKKDKGVESALLLLLAFRPITPLAWSELAALQNCSQEVSVAVGALDW